MLSVHLYHLEGVRLKTEDSMKDDQQKKKILQTYHYSASYILQF